LWRILNTNLPMLGSAVNPENVWSERARAVAGPVLGRDAADVDSSGRWPAESVAALADAGLLGLTVPAALGGAGQGPQTFQAVTRVLAEQCASSAMIFLMHVCATQVVIAADGLADRERILQDVAAGRHLLTLAFSEKGSRSHFWAPVSQAVPAGAAHRLSAQKSWVTSAGHADGYIVSAGSPERQEATSSNLYYVPRDVPGLSVSGPWNGLGLRGNASAPVRLDDVSVPLARRIGSDGAGFGMMLNTVLPWFQLGSAAVSVGIGRAATTAVCRHLLAAQLEHLGQPLASLPNLRARLAQMQTLVDVQQAFLGHVAERLEHPAPDTMLAVLQCKAAAAETALQVTDLAMRACGGAAFSKQLSVERHFRDARAAWVMAPTTDVLYDFIGKSVLGMPLF
jgi:alkylation response protein AidB-like acyl-CoA dehydrogenase